MDGLKTAKGVLLAGLETTYLANTTLTGAANAILIKDVNVTPLDLGPQARNVIKPYLGADEEIPTGATVRIEFTVELAGSGVAGVAPGWGPLMQACAMEEVIVATTSVEYKPVSSAMKSAYLVYNLDGLKHGLKGARGSFSLQANAKSLPEIRFSFTGLYEPVTTQTVTGVDYSDFIKPKAVNFENTPDCTLLGQDLVLDTFSFDVANNVVYNNLVNLENVEITDRTPSAQISFRNVLTTAYDWWAAVKSVQTGAFLLRHGTVAGNIVEISAPSAQPTNPTLSDKDGTSMLNLKLNIIPTDAGNDELSIKIV